MYRQERGSVMIVVLMIMAVLLVLGTAMVSVSTSEVRFAQRHEQQTQANYLARSGANVMARWVIDIAEDHEGDIENAVEGDWYKWELEEGAFEVKLSGEYGEVMYIYSKGKVGNYQEEVQLTLIPGIKEADYPVFDKAIFSDSHLDIDHEQSHVEGDVASNESVETQDDFEYEADCPETSDDLPRFYPSPRFPNDITEPGGELTIQSDTEEVITSDSYYEEIEVQSHGELEVETGGKDVSLVVDTIQLLSGGELNIKGGGRLFLFVNDNMDVQTPYVNAGEDEDDPDPNSLVVFMDDGGIMEMQAGGGDNDDVQLNGFFYGPGAGMYIQAHAKIQGAILANEVHRSTSGDQALHGEVQYEHSDIDELEDILNHITTDYDLGTWSY